MVEKILNRVKGYKGFTVSRNIAIEYNEWVRENDPERFKKFSIPE